MVRTRLEGRFSHQKQHKQGVPQASVLSPLLFIFYIAEMLTNAKGIKFRHANDSQILKSASVENAFHRTLQKNLNIVKKWCRTWRIQIKSSKTEIMHINSDELTTSVFTLWNEEFKVKSRTKTFGLIVDNAWTFKGHTEPVAVRCKIKWRELRIHCTSRWGLYRKHTNYFIQNADSTNSTVLCASLVETKCGKTANLPSYCQSKYTSNQV